MKKQNYYLDLEAICDFVTGENSKIASTEIREVYAPDDEGTLKLVSRDVSENKVTSDTSYNVRYNLFTQLLDAIELHDEEDGDDYGTTVKMNTMLTYGFLKAANDKK